MRIINSFAALSLFGSLLAFAPVQAGETPAAATSIASFANLKDGDSVQNPVIVKFAVTDMAIAPAGEKNTPNSGHYHLLVDATLSAEEMKFAIPNDETHLHFGKGQTETTLTLKPGKHILQIVMGDARHELHTPPVMSKPITIEVK